jgi:hypothetical protein
MCRMSSAPVAADTIGGTTGISQPPNAASGSTVCWVNIRNGMLTAVNEPPTVPAVHNTPVQLDGQALPDHLVADQDRAGPHRQQRHRRRPV